METMQKKEEASQASIYETKSLKKMVMKKIKNHISISSMKILRLNTKLKAQ